MQVSAHVSVLSFRNGSDCALKHGAGYYGINLTGAKEVSTYSDVFRIIADETHVQAKLRFVNCTNIDNLNLLQIQFGVDEPSKILVNKGNVTVEEGSFYLIRAGAAAHLVLSQKVETLEESCLLAIEISFSPEDWGSTILLIRIL